MVKEIEVTFETITPLWTGDAWRENSQIRPSSILGALRFWFAVYWRVIKNGRTEEMEDGKIVEKLKYLDFANKLKERIPNLNGNISLEEVADQILEEMEISVPSRIFGCTGWKSRVEIKNLRGNTLSIEKRRLNYYFFINRIEIRGRKLNTKFWIEKSLFKDKETLNFFKNVQFILSVKEYWWENYLKEFFAFLEHQEQILLVGGKKSFGFGIVKIGVTNEDLPQVETGEEKLTFVKRINNFPFSNKKVLGFNFKYYLRRKERDKSIRKKYFGTQGKASLIYASHLLEDNSIYLIGVNNPFGNATFIEGMINHYATFFEERT